MNQFIFSCPFCHQQIEVGFEFANRQIDCPVCQTSLMVPPAPTEDGTVPAATPAPPAAQPTPAATTPVVAAPAGQAPAAGPAPGTTVAPISSSRVAVLTPAIKLEVVHAARARISDPAHWLPGKIGIGQYNYAARREGDNLVPVPPTDAAATHFSLFGAILLEFHRRNVTRMTTGRHKFLDVELTAAIQQTLGRHPDTTPGDETEREALTHEQCLAVLDVLEAAQQQATTAAREQQAKRSIEYIRLTDLLKKLESSAPIQAQEVVCALYYELEELNKRIVELERKGKKQN